MTGAVSLPREEIALERGLLTGVAAFRWAAWIWMTVVIAVDARNPDTFDRLPVAIAFSAAAVAFTLWATLAARGGPARLLATTPLVVEGLLAVAMVFADNLVYNPHLYPHAQSLGSIWPFAWVLTVAVRFAGRGGALAGILLGVTNWVGELLFVPDAPWSSNRVSGVFGTAVLYTLGGGVAGFVAIKLREAERQIAVARAREEVARTLHDGVLQTLAIVQRRSEDRDLTRLAREQEVELREFLFGTLSSARSGRSDAPDLAASLRQVAAKVERSHGTRANVVTAGELPDVGADVVVALSGAVAESLTNAAKHGDAHQATVFLEPAPDGGIFCSVKDDGRGFETGGVTEGIGITRSIRGRITEIGGRVEIDGRPGRGTEVRLWIP